MVPEVAPEAAGEPVLFGQVVGQPEPIREGRDAVRRGRGHQREFDGARQGHRGARRGPGPHPISSIKTLLPSPRGAGRRAVYIPLRYTHNYRYTPAAFDGATAVWPTTNLPESRLLL